jgi:small subunit ribosomal protein S27Ae
MTKSLIEMQLLLKSLSGHSILIDVNTEDNVEDLKSIIEYREGIPFDQQILYYKTNVLQNSHQLSESSIVNNSTIDLTVGLLGGAKKRKKKSYTTPKKNKRKKNKIKMSVLRFYRVDQNGKISRLRRECTSEECGAGVRMAAHFDRLTCGKCGLTLAYKHKMNR